MSGEKKGRQEIYNRRDAEIDAEFDEIFKDLANASIEGMPELTILLQDDSIMERFEDPKTIEYLRKISIDPANIDTLKDEPEIRFLTDKIEAAKQKVRASGGTPSGSTPAPAPDAASSSGATK